MNQILVVDDNSTILRMLSFILERNHYGVMTVDNGTAALEQLQNHTFDLAIIDLAMPDMNGLTLLTHVRADPALNQLPIIMLTASGSDQDRVIARQSGANAFLTKPTSSRELLETVSKLLG